MTTSLQNSNLTLPLIADKHLAADVHEESDEQSPSRHHSGLDMFDIILSVAMPILLRTQFAVTLSHQTLAAASSFEALPINSAVAASFLSSLMYRKMIQDCATESNFFFILPEIITTISIVLLSCDNILMGFLCLSLGSAAMALAFACTSFTSLLSNSSESWLTQFCMTLALPCFISVQYNWSFATEITDMQGLLPAAANYACAIFLFASIMYRQVLQDEQVVGFMFHLLPEVIATSTMVLTACGAVAAGFFCLLIGECGLAVVGVAFCCRSLWMAFRQLQSTKLGDVEAESLSAPFLDEATIV